MTSHTGGAVAASAAEVTTVKAVAHTKVLATVSKFRTVVRRAAVVVAVATHVPGMTAAIGSIEVRASEVEVVTMGIAGIDAEVPETSVPIQRTIEIGGGTESLPLPRVEDVLKVEVTALPVDTENVGLTCHTHQVVEVDFVGSLVLCSGKIQLVGHLIGQEQSLVAGLLVAHGIG